MTEGAPLAILAVVLLAGGLFLETRVLLRLRWEPWFRLAFPVPVRLADLPRAPAGSGRTESVRWEVGASGAVRFWAEPGSRSAPIGLRGLVTASPAPRGVALTVRCAPPFTLLAAPAWLAALGVWRGEGPVVGPLAVGMLLFVGWWYGRAAARAARELRWAFVGAADGRP